MDPIMSPVLLYWSFAWFAIFYVIYFYKRKQVSWERRRNIAIVAVLIPMTVLFPLHVWGTYNLAGLENDGIHVSGIEPWVTSLHLSSNTTYKSDTLSNRYALETAYVGITSFDEFVFYIVDENIPEARYEDFESGHLPIGYRPYFTLDPYFIFSLRLPYFYSFLFVEANWTMNIHNPSLNTSIDLTFLIHGSGGVLGSHEWALRYYLLQGRTIALVSLCIIYVSSTLIALSHYDEYEP